MPAAKRTKQQKRAVLLAKQRANDRRETLRADKIARGALAELHALTRATPSPPPHKGPAQSSTADRPLNTKHTVGFGDTLHAQHDWRKVEYVKARQKWGIHDVVRARQMTDLVNGLVDAMRKSRNSAVLSQPVYEFAYAWKAMIAHDEDAASEVTRERLWAWLTETIGSGSPIDVWEIVFGHPNGPARVRTSPLRRFEKPKGDTKKGA